MSKEEIARSLQKEKDLNELKSRFVSIASHEFRTPLTTILSSINLIEKYTQTEDQPKRKRHVDRILVSIQTLIGILNDFLSVGKIEEGKLQVNHANFSVSHFINRVVEDVQDIKKADQQIIYEHDGEDEVYLDNTLLKHILVNLLSNSIKYSGDVALIKIKSENNGDTLTIKVADNGIGISKEDQQHLTERFFRASNSGNFPGTGLGLHIVSKYVEMLNGNLVCISELNYGTEMIITFNLQSEEAMVS